VESQERPRRKLVRRGREEIDRTNHDESQERPRRKMVRRDHEER
jgi:hypothetical protein